MASVVWVAVFVLLMLELFITAVLVLPLPRIVRRFLARKIFNYNLAKRVRFVSNFVILGLMLAVWDAITTLRHLQGKEESTGEGALGAMSVGGNGYISASFDKQRKFRAERNMYLSGFSLTLVFVIARIVELMQESFNTEEEKDVLKQRLDDMGATASQTTDIPASAGSTPYSLRKRGTASTDTKDE